MKTFEKHPDAIKSYTRKWKKWLNGDTISTSTWTVESGITIDTSSNDTESATVKLSGGTIGVSYCITNTIVTTTSAETELMSFKVFIHKCEENTGDYC